MKLDFSQCKTPEDVENVMQAFREGTGGKVIDLMAELRASLKKDEIAGIVRKPRGEPT